MRAGGQVLSDLRSTDRPTACSSRRAKIRYVAHYHTERNHQGKHNVLLFPVASDTTRVPGGPVYCQERLGGLLKYYHGEAA